MIETCDINNKDEVHVLLKAFFDESPFSFMEYSEEKVSNLFDQLSSDKENSVILCLRDGDIKGILVATCVPLMFTYQQVATELVWYVTPEYRGRKGALELLDTYEYWAKEVVKADAVTMSCLDERVAKLYSIKGYKKQEEAWFKPLKEK